MSGSKPIPRRRAARNAKLASIPLGIAGRAVSGLGQRMVGASREDVSNRLAEQAADQLFSVLGELKGGAMKFGQALSVLEAAVPADLAEPYREALTKLQSQASPMSAEIVERVLNRQLGTAWRDRFQSFDLNAAASASIGQVHRAVWADGREVAVKIQYPGADEALRADLKTLNRFAKMFSQLAQMADVKPILSELNERMEEELDYRIEAANQRRFAAAFADDPQFVVPKVVASSPRVIVTEWVHGHSLAQVIKSGTHAERNWVGELMSTFHFSSPARAGMLHSDPHPGNFMITPERKLCIIDFGACAPMPDGFPAPLGRIVRLARDRNFPDLMSLLELHGFVVPGRTVTIQEIDDYLRPFTDPLHSETFHFTREWMQKAAGAAMDWDRFKTTRALALPPEYLMISRVLLGSVGVLCQLDATAPYMRILAEWLPGYADSADHR